MRTYFYDNEVKTVTRSGRKIEKFIVYEIKHKGDGYEFLQDYYKKIKNGDIKEGDIIIYLDEADNKKHFAKVYETNGTIKDTIIRSKWGQLGVYETTIYEIPNIYGCYIEIWRKENEM